MDNINDDDYGQTTGDQSMSISGHQPQTEFAIHMRRIMGNMKVTLEQTHNVIHTVLESLQDQSQNTRVLEVKLEAVLQKLESCEQRLELTTNGTTSAICDDGDHSALCCYAAPSVYTVPSFSDLSSSPSTSEYSSVVPASISSVVQDPDESARKASNAREQAALGKQLLKAAHGGKTEEVRKLLEAGVDADARFTYRSKWTPLHRAAWSACPDVVALLLDSGANVHATTAQDFTALHIAAYNDSSGKCVSLLINAGSDVNGKNMTGWTPLHHAAECANTAAVELLLDAGADTYIRNCSGKTPMDVAKKENVRNLFHPFQRQPGTQEPTMHL